MESSVTFNNSLALRLEGQGSASGPHPAFAHALPRQRSLAARMGVEGPSLSERLNLPQAPLAHRLRDVRETILPELTRVAAGEEEDVDRWAWTDALAADGELQQLVSTQEGVELLYGEGDRGPDPLPNTLHPRSPGYLLLEGHGSVRAAVWRSRVGANDWNRLLVFLMRHGVEFTWAVPESALTPPHAAPEPLSWMHTDPVAEWWNHEPHNLQASWAWAVAEVLSRPHAVRALSRGGVIWRLAIEFGSPSLFHEAMQGPSSVTTHYRRGASHQASVPVYADVLSQAEEDALTGRLADGRSLFPRNEEFMLGRLWDGEWSRWCEKWFRERMNGIRAGFEEARQLGRLPGGLFAVGWYRRLLRATGPQRREIQGTGSVQWLLRLASRTPGLASLSQLPIVPNENQEDEQPPADDEERLDDPQLEPGGGL